MSINRMAQFLRVTGCSSTAIAFAILVYCLFVKRAIRLLRWVIALGLIGAMCLYQYARYIPLVR